MKFVASFDKNWTKFRGKFDEAAKWSKDDNNASKKNRTQ